MIRDGMRYQSLEMNYQTRDELSTVTQLVTSFGAKPWVVQMNCPAHDELTRNVHAIAGATPLSCEMEKGKSLDQ